MFYPRGHFAVFLLNMAHQDVSHPRSRPERGIYFLNLENVLGICFVAAYDPMGKCYEIYNGNIVPNKMALYNLLQTN